jgi:cysteinyl-tRNA synthetase
VAIADDEARIQSLVDARNVGQAAAVISHVADAIRKQLLDEGIAMEDTPQGARWKRVG